jgi:hypothetical protein
MKLSHVAALAALAATPAAATTPAAAATPEYAVGFTPDHLSIIIKQLNPPKPAITVPLAPGATTAQVHGCGIQKWPGGVVVVLDAIVRTNTVERYVDIYSLSGGFLKGVTTNAVPFTGNLATLSCSISIDNGWIGYRNLTGTMTAWNPALNLVEDLLEFPDEPAGSFAVTQ